MSRWLREKAERNTSAASLSIDSAGTEICGTPVQTRTRYGTVPALLPGNSGMHRIVRQESSVASKGGAVAKPAHDYGRAPRLTTAFRCFECGPNIGRRRGRSYSIFGACQTFRSSIVTFTPQNAPSRRGTVVPHAFLKLNSPESSLL
jgi:hypothetical protein